MGRLLGAAAVLARLALCGAHPLHSQDAAPSLEYAALAPAALAVLTIVTIVVFLAGCVCCRRNKFTQFTNTTGNETLPELSGSGHRISVPSSPADTGIVNPIAEREFTIFGPLSPENHPRPRENVSVSPEHARIAQIQFYGPIDIENNNPPFENNNNGPISPQELENIVNNNAENYIVSEYENRNLNYPPENENNAVEEAHSSRNFQEPLHHVQDHGLGRLEEHREWFEYPLNYFPRNQLQYLQEIGKGWFGRIVEADAHNLDYSNSNIPTNKNIAKVAVKILDENVSVGEKCVFLDESKIYKNSQDKNILKILGFNLEQDPWLIIFEHCSLGDLKTFLKTNHSSAAILSDKGIPLKFQCEVASALSYLHSHNVVHPDISCHSCMVTENLNVKLGEYGGAPLQHPSDFYYVFDKPLPIRWLAPESWMQTSSNYSNMWSFGVLLWESSSWGVLPYENLSNDQIISTVLVQDGIRLSQPSSSSVFGSYLYQIMQSCWQENPADRITASQALILLNYIFSNCFETDESDKDPWTCHFEQRWQNMKPNTITKVDNANEEKSRAQNYESISKADSVYPTPECSTDIQLDDFSKKMKSDSLNNLHGSFDSIQGKDSTESEKNSFKESDSSFTGSTYVTPLHKKGASMSSSNCEVAPWLQDLPVTSQEDMTYIKTVSDVISDLDNMLSSEKTSSSESSHQTSPSRDTTNNTVSSNKHISIDMFYSVKNDLLDKNVCDNDRPSSSANSQNEKNVESYPTLDFRLTELEKPSNEIHPIFQTKCNINTSQDFDSLSSSYIPDSASVNKLKLSKQYSSGSETEDEIWKNRVEVGSITEKIKLKSKSVTDFMVLTHIDIDFTDMDSEDASITSIDGKTMSIGFDRYKKRHRHDSPLKDSSLPVGDCASFPRNSSFTSAFRSDVNWPEVDVHKLKRNLWNLTLRSLRPTKSQNDLSTVMNKEVVLTDLLNFKKALDSFLDNKLNVEISKSQNETSISTVQQDSWNSTKYLKLPENESQPIENDHKKVVPTNNPYDPLQSAFTSDINLNANTSTPKENTAGLTDGTKDNFTPFVDKHTDKTFTVLKLKQTAVDDELAFKSKETVENYTDSNVSLGPFSECTLDLYTGLKTDFKDSDMAISEEEALMFSSNFNCEQNVNPTTEQSVVKSHLPDNYFDVSSAYFFNSSAVNQSASDADKNLTYSIETWDRFLGSSFERNSPKNFDSIFPEVKEDYSDLSSIDGIECMENNSSHVFRNVLSDSIVGILPMSTSHTDYETSQKEFNSLASKLAMAENENNMNLELSIPQGGLDTVEFVVANSNFTDENEFNVPSAHYTDTSISNLSNGKSSSNIHDINNVKGENINMTSQCGWFLHEKRNDDMEDPESDSSLDTFDREKAYLKEDCEKIDKKSHRKNFNPALDAQSVEALRTELELKLPLAQMINQCSNVTEIKDVGSNTAVDFCEQSTQVTQNCSQNKSLDLSNEPSCSDAEAQIPRNEVLIHYKIPLSPIQEETWSEFSEMGNRGEFNKSDTSNSLSLGQLNSLVLDEKYSNEENELNPIFTNYEIDNENKSKENTDDEANDDSHDSNRTFIIKDGNERSLIDKRLSVSADSLNCIEDHMEMDCEPEINNMVTDEKTVVFFPVISHPITEVLSHLGEDLSNTKSTDEISQNVDNLLENISKTLENASKVASVASDSISKDHGTANPFDDASSSNSENSKTYVIECKNLNANDITYTCQKKVLNLPDDISNISKISQPSLLSDTVGSESQMKPSEKSASLNLHTKTPSIDSWCSNDTLYNVEENFDDNISLNDFHESEILSNTNTPTNEDVDNIEFDKKIIEHGCGSCSQAASSEKYLAKYPSVEMVLNYPKLDNTENLLDNIVSNNSMCAKSESPVLYRDPQISVINNSSDESNVTAVDTTDIKITINTPSPSTSKCITATSTPVFGSDSTQDSIDSAQSLIDTQFNFLNELGPTPNLLYDEDPVCSLQNQHHNESTNSGSHSYPSIINFVSVEQKAIDLKNLQNATLDFLEGEKNFMHAENLGYNKIHDKVVTLSPLEVKKSTENFLKIQPDSIQDISPILFDDSSSTSEISHLVISNSSAINLLKPDFTCIEDISPPALEDFSLVSEQSLDKTSASKLSKPEHSLIEQISPITFVDSSSDSNLNLITTNETGDLSSFLSYTDFQKSVDERTHGSDCNNAINCQDSVNYDNESKIYEKTDSNLSEYLAHSGINLKSLQSNQDSTTFKMDLENTSNVMSPALSNNLLGMLTSAPILPSMILYVSPQNPMIKIYNLINNRKYFYQRNPIFEIYAQEIKISCSAVLSQIYCENTKYNTSISSGLMSESLHSSISSYGILINSVEDINTVAPECLKDWDSESEESNGNSSSSGEFTWKKGDSEELITLSTSSVHLSPNTVKNKIAPLNNTYDIIVEESNNSNSSESPSDEEIEFTPSIWNRSAIPGKSSLKSSDTVQIENKKKVVFKKQKHYCVYEYPREASDNEGDSPNLYYSDWQNKCKNSDMDAQFGTYEDLCGDSNEIIPEEIAQTDEFHSRFHTYIPNPSSQFFPGQHLSLVDSNKSSNDEDEMDDEPLPPIPPESFLINQDDGEDGNIITLLENVKLADFITPDSGTEDVTPGSLLDYHINEAVDNKNEVHSKDREGCPAPVIPSNHEFLLNITNKSRSNINYGSLILPSKGSQLETITPSPLGNDYAISSQSSGSTSPQGQPVLGGLRHTRDKLKLDLPPSPLTRNSPNQPKIFDFKNLEHFAGVEIQKSKSADKITVNPISNIEGIIADKNTDCVNLSKPEYTESPDSLSSTEKLIEVGLSCQTWSSASESRNIDSATLQKAVIPIHLGDHLKKSIIEPVKGEGTLLDSGDEDSGIGNSAYTTLERKIDNTLKAKSNDR